MKTYAWNPSTRKSRAGWMVWLWSHLRLQNETLSKTKGNKTVPVLCKGRRSLHISYWGGWGRRTMSSSAACRASASPYWTTKADSSPVAEFLLGLWALLGSILVDQIDADTCMRNKHMHDEYYPVLSMKWILHTSINNSLWYPSSPYLRSSLCHRCMDTSTNHHQHYYFELTLTDRSLFWVICQLCDTGQAIFRCKSWEKEQ